MKDSVVGAINTGYVQQLDVAVDAIREAGQPDVAMVVQALTQAVLDAPDLEPSQKNAAVEHLTFLAQQASLPSHQRHTALGKTIIAGLERLLNAAASAVALWPVARPLLEKLFQ